MDKSVILFIDYYHFIYVVFQYKFLTISVLFLDPNYDGDAGEFKRSASARLHRNKRNYPDIFGEQNFVAASGVLSHNGNIPEDNRRKEQVMILI